MRPGQATGTLLRLEGKDSLALLHRISTQSLLELAPGQACATLFCDYRGRLLHRAWVAVTSDHVVWLVRDDAPTLPLADFVERFIFRPRRLSNGLRSCVLPMAVFACSTVAARTRPRSSPRKRAKRASRSVISAAGSCTGRPRA